MPFANVGVFTNIDFKSKFAPSISTFTLAGLVHDQDAFDKLVAGALEKQPELAGIPYFLKYRLVGGHS